MTDDVMEQLSPAESARYRVTHQARRPRRFRLPSLGIRTAIAAVNRWQADIPDQGRVVLIGLLLLGVGLALQVGVAAALIAGATVLVLVGLGFDFRHYVTATALVLAVAIVLVVTIVRVS